MHDFDALSGDSISRHNNQQFSTYDADHDTWPNNCASQYKGGWWYRNCHKSNLNGKYVDGGTPASSPNVVWYHWHTRHTTSLKKTVMMIRPKID